MTPTRTKRPTTMALDPELLDRLEAWMRRQEFPPTKTQVWETALREFLDKRDKKR